MTYSLPNGNQVRMMMVNGRLTLVEVLPDGEKRMWADDAKEYQREITDAEPSYWLPGDD